MPSCDRPDEPGKAVDDSPEYGLADDGSQTFSQARAPMGQASAGTSPTANGPDRDPSRWVHPALADCYYLTGPTGSGKTPLALTLAEELNAEIISLDSMAVYREMNIGTAKPTPQQIQRVPHHLIDLVDPTEAYSVSMYVLDAHRVAEEIRAAGKRVLVCGGTPLYLKSLVRGFFLGPAADWEFRDAVESDLEKHGPQALLSRLEQVDPLLAHKLHPNDHRRIIRALEVAKITGEPLSHWQQQFERPADPQKFPVAVLKLERAWLHQRINERVESMLESGLVKETRGLLGKYGRLGRTASQAVGYREVLEHLEKGTSIDATQAEIKAHTRQFARRQEIWFRGLRELQWVEVTPNKPTRQIADEILKLFAQSGN